MNKIGGFGYYTNTHTYVTFYQSDRGYCIELQGHTSRLVPNLFDQIDENYVMWILVNEIEEFMRITNIEA